MKKLIIIAIAAGLLAGCSEYSRADRALGGGLIGAGAGAVIGGAATRSAGGAVVGGVLGGAAGAIVGAETTPRACTRRYRGYDGYIHYRRVQCR